MNVHLNRSRALIDLRRYDLAKNELLAALQSDPNDSDAHALLAHVLLQLNQHPWATKEAKEAIRIVADNHFAHFTLACIFGSRGKTIRALNSIREALRIAPYVSTYHWYLGEIEFTQSRWKQSLTATEAGLSLNPNDIDCILLRTRTLLRLGRREEAATSIDQALRIAPEYFENHEKKGQIEILKGNVAQAISLFREALRLNPNNEAARQGLIEALKSRNAFYRFLLWLYAGNAAERSMAWLKRGFIASFSIGLCIAIPLGIWILVLLILEGPPPSLESRIALGLQVTLMLSFFISLCVWAIYLVSLPVFHWLGIRFFDFLIAADPLGRRALQLARKRYDEVRESSEV